MSSKHFSVDGTTGEAWASQKSFRPKQEKRDDDEPTEGGRNREVDFRGQQRRNETQESATDAEARLWRKSQTAEAKRSDLGHVLGENRHGLIVNVRVTRAHGGAEREAAVEMAREIPGGRKRVTLGADRGYDTREFVEQLKDRNVTPHGAQNVSGRRSAVDGRTTRHEGYWASQRRRKGVEELFGWAKVVAGLKEGEAEEAGEGGMAVPVGGGLQPCEDEEDDGGGCLQSAGGFFLRPSHGRWKASGQGAIRSQGFLLGGNRKTEQFWAPRGRFFSGLLKPKRTDHVSQKADRFKS